MVVRRSVFEEVGGFEEEHLKVAFNDVDLCLKVRAAGYRNLWTPYAELYHHESLSRGKEDSGEKLERFRAESNHMIKKWKNQLYDDPCYNPNLTLMDEHFGIAWKPRTDVGFPSIGQKLGRMLPKPIARRLIGILEFGH
jgi:GT2 family glycosyltransferase